MQSSEILKLIEVNKKLRRDKISFLQKIEHNSKSLMYKKVSGDVQYYTGYLDALNKILNG